MKAFDWLKFVGVYAAAAVGTAAVTYLVGRETLGVAVLGVSRWARAAALANGAAPSSA